MIRLQTSLGTIDIELDHDKAPKTAANFEQYVKEGFYDGTLFHRVIDGFMVQGGGMEPGLKNELPTVVPARTADPHSATAQFFINIANNDFLNFTSPTPNGCGYCVFGRVVDGMDVVEKIKDQPTTSKMGHQDVPVDDIIIEHAQIVD